MTGSHSVERSSDATPLVFVLLAGAAVSLLFGAYGRIHDPTGETTLTLFFTSTINLKVWFATGALFFAFVQVATAARLFGKINFPRQMPACISASAQSLSSS